MPDSFENVTIMWKEIVIIFAFLFLVRFMFDVYMLKQYNAIVKDFYANKSVYGKIKKLQKICNIFSSALWNQKTCLMYNNLCCILASIALLNNNESEFLLELNNVKREEKYELKSFILALYFLSKNNQSMAQSNYEKYLICKHENNNINIVLSKLFSSQNYSKNDETFLNAIASFKNPAIKKLLSEYTGEFTV